LRITRFPSLTESQFAGCMAAFLDVLEGELNSAVTYLRRLENRAKGSAFAYEMELDRHRYGALIVLDRWLAVTAAFGADPGLAEHADAIARAPEQVRVSAETVGRANAVIDAADGYSSDVVEGCALAFQAVRSGFAGERESARRYAELGPMLPEDYRQARAIFLEDLAAR
jgi:hypothetical protein